MPGDDPDLTLAPVDERAGVRELVDDVFSDPETRRGIGWTEADDPERAREAITDLWDRRFDEGWRVLEVRAGEARAGMAGLGPVEDGEAWWAVYLLERGRGLGRAVGRRLAGRARRQGVRELVAVTWAENDASRRMLEALGFDERGPAPYEWAEESALAWVEYRRRLEAAGGA